MAEPSVLADEGGLVRGSEAGWSAGMALDRLARGLLIALPILFIIGRAPPRLRFP
ncbi:MAG: hypothetical protein HC871_08410 [Rhizobiales bacterium]|nr:hypothetical protein [Hyphomicrobiales bacterium]